MGDCLDADVEDDVQLVREALARQRGGDRPNGLHTLVVFLITLTLFVGGERLSTDATIGWIGALVLVLLVHEAGHYAAMRVFGYTDLKVFFIPLFGAGAKGVKSDATATQQAMVSLMGPFPGLVLGLAAAALLPLDRPFVNDFVVLSVVINALNLLPFYPLDGGRYLDVTVFARWPRAREVMTLLGGVGLVVMGWWLDAWVLMAFGGVVFVLAGPERMAAEGAADLKMFIDPALPVPESIPDELVPRAMEVANENLFHRVANAKPKAYANVIRSYWRWVGFRPPSPGRTALLLAAYGGTILLAFAAFVMYVAAGDADLGSLVLSR